MTPFDYSAVLRAGLPPAAVRWTGLAKYNFTGGNNDADQVPVDGLIAAANAVLAREGRSLATYGLASGPQGYRPLREFLVGKLKRDAGIACTAADILIVSGSLQALDLVNGALLTRGDTVICEKDCYQGTLTRFARLGVNAIGIPLDHDGMRMDALAAGLEDCRKRIHAHPVVVERNTDRVDAEPGKARQRALIAVFLADDGVAAREQRAVHQVERLQRAGYDQDVGGGAGDAGIALELADEEFAQGAVALRAACKPVGRKRTPFAGE